MELWSIGSIGWSGWVGGWVGWVFTVPFEEGRFFQHGVDVFPHALEEAGHFLGHGWFALVGLWVGGWVGG